MRYLCGMTFAVLATAVPLAGAAGNLSPAVGVSVGHEHSCAVSEAGVVRCWGRNDSGQSGYPVSDRLAFARVVEGQSGRYIAVEAGRWHSCAITEGGGLHCWGRNDHGQLGAGDVDPHEGVVAVEGLIRPVTSVAVGGEHTCAHLDDASVWCWGSNSRGQLGADAADPSVVPALVSGISDTSHIYAGPWITCAVSTAGDTLCWGVFTGDFGVVGGTPASPSGVPPDVVEFDFSSVPTNFFGVGMPPGYACALAGSGNVSCWTPWEVENWGGNPDFVGLAAGYDFACAIDAQGEVWCRGENAVGQLGRGSVPASSVWTKVDLVEPAVSVSTAFWHVCAILASGDVSCWGYNAHGQLGDGTTAAGPEPRRVEGAVDVLSLAAGNSHTCASTATSTFCWGSNENGQLGDGSELPRPYASPVQIIGPSDQIVVGDRHSCSRQGGTIFCWGSNSAGQTGDTDYTVTNRPPTAVPGLPQPVTDLAAARGKTCAVADSVAYCNSGMITIIIGDPPPVTPSLVEDTRFFDVRAMAIASGWVSMDLCALTNPGAVACPANPDAAVSMPAGIPALSAGGSHYCVLNGTGEVMCWGANTRGQLGDGSQMDSSIPVSVPLPLPAIQVAAGGSHTCALLHSDGSVYCWGDNRVGQLGVSGVPLSTSAQHTAELPAPALAISAGRSHTCAALEDTSTYCWGEGQAGQAGGGLRSYFDPAPVMQSADPTTITIAGAPAEAVAGSSFLVQARVASVETAPTNGQVHVTASSGDRCTGASGAASGVLEALYECSLTISASGSAALTAVYGGNEYYLSSESPAFPVDVIDALPEIFDNGFEP